MNDNSSHEYQNSGDSDEGHEFQSFYLFDQNGGDFHDWNDKSNKGSTGIPFIFNTRIDSADDGCDAILKDDDFQDTDADIVKEDDDWS